MPSANRTVTVPLPPAHLPGVQALVPAISWPDALPDAVLDYTADVAGWLADAGDVAMTSVALSIAPSGAGEMGCVSLDVAGGQIIAVLGPAPPGRGCLVRIEAMTNSLLRFEWVLGLNIVPIQAEYDPPSEPASYGFGTPVVWPAAETGLTDSAGNVLTDSSGNLVFGSPGTTSPASLTDNAGNVLTDSSGNLVFSSPGTTGPSPLTDNAGNVILDSAGNPVFGSP